MNLPPCKVICFVSGYSFAELRIVNYFSIKGTIYLHLTRRIHKRNRNSSRTIWEDVLQLCSRVEGRSRWIGNLGRRSEQIENEAVQQNDILTRRIINPLPKNPPLSRFW